MCMLCSCWSKCQKLQIIVLECYNFLAILMGKTFWFSLRQHHMVLRCTHYFRKLRIASLLIMKKTWQSEIDDLVVIEYCQYIIFIVLPANIPFVHHVVWHPPCYNSLPEKLIRQSTFMELFIGWIIEFLEHPSDLRAKTFLQYRPYKSSINHRGRWNTHKHAQRNKETMVQSSLWIVH